MKAKFKKFLEKDKHMKAKKIIEIVERFYNLEPGTLHARQDSRERPFVFYRQQAMYFIRSTLDMSLKEVGEIFNKDHATVAYTRKVIENMLFSDKDFQQQFIQLSNFINEGMGGWHRIVLVDIDGTISKVGDRLKYIQQKPEDWDSFYNSCFDDEPIEPILKLVNDLYILNYQLVFCTGRRESCRDKTIEWLNKYLPKEAARNILMRANSDFRHDTEVKPDLLKKAGIELTNIKFVLEDRNSMVQKWRELGLTCLQVADGNY